MPVRRSILLLAVLALVAACGPGAGSASPAVPGSASADASASTGASESPDASAPHVALTVGLGYIPSVQFAQFYLADQAGYYDEAGLDVTFQNKIDPDLVTLVGQGSIDLGLADGTSVIPAVSNGIPIKYVATIYGKFPSVVFAKASSGIAAPKDLKGKRLGIPGRFGSSWIMLQALLKSAGLTPNDLQIIEYPDFGQGAAVAQGAVDAATGFVNNEPVQLQLSGEKVNILRVDEITPLPGNGLIVGKAAMESKRDAVAAFIAATLHAMADIEADPEKGLDAAIKAVPELGADRDTQAAILDATIDVWRGPVQESKGLGAIEPADWEKSVAFMTDLGLVPNPVTTDQLVDTGLLPQKG
ncbi:MAG TPA: ABC transporter substrate-binding protein [Candidatus Limnocylindrales bacterium]|nr:ABC transporter substrate-binding protein [Candidatus Limnocylindrales bacterium]